MVREEAEGVHGKPGYPVEFGLSQPATGLVMAAECGEQSRGRVA